MTVQVNQSVVTGFATFPLDSFYFPNIPPFAQPACLSNVQQAPWTNRVPQHEPWPRTLMGDTVGANAPNDESERNTSHNPQFVDDGGGIGSQSIGRVEGETTIQRGEFWRR
jgi:hypothetical protein